MKDIVSHALSCYSHFSPADQVHVDAFRLTPMSPRDTEKLFASLTPHGVTHVQIVTRAVKTLISERRRK